jgi:hypothetical protein
VRVTLCVLPLDRRTVSLSLVVLRSFSRLSGLRVLAPFRRALVLPLTATVAETILVPAGALSLSFSLRPLTQRVAAGRPS